MGLPSHLVSFPTKLPSKRHEKIRVTFFTGNKKEIVDYALLGLSMNIISIINIKQNPGDNEMRVSEGINY